MKTSIGKKTIVPFETDLTDTGQRLRHITSVNDLADALKSNRAPRGKAALRNQLMSEARALQSDMDSLIILSSGNKDSTYDGMYPETVGVALAKKRCEVYALGLKCVDLLPGYVWELPNPEAAGVPLKMIEPLPSLKESTPVLKITRSLAALFAPYIKGRQTLTDLVLTLKQQGITVRSMGQTHRGCTIINPVGKISLLIVEDATGHYSSVTV